MSSYNPINIGEFCTECKLKGIDTDTSKLGNGYVNRIPSENHEYIGMMCGPCVSEMEDEGDQLRAEENLGIILEDALKRAKDNKLAYLGLETEEIVNICERFGYKYDLEENT